ncbi:MAG: peptidase T [Janthinobacterium lividum]
MIDTDLVAEELVERFMRYAAVDSQSDAATTALPSTPGQLRLAEMLRDELKELGLAAVHLGADGILTARLPGTVRGAPTIGFVAHLDTVDVGLSPEVRPQRLPFEGEDLLLSAELNIQLRVAEHPEILPYRGQEILFGDGTSVLGADDKAGVAAIMTLLAKLGRDGGRHGDVVVAFVPDEEVGLRGSKALDLARFPADWAYTIDGGARGEVVYETFNAASARITIAGVTAHGGKAKGVMVNPMLIAAEFMNAFDPRQTPEHTAVREGYW